MRTIVSICLTVCFFTSYARAASTDPSELLGFYEMQARRTDPGFRANPVRGDAFFHRQNPPRPGAEAPPTSCAECHTPDPRREGLNTRNQKKLEPLAPSAASRRFSDRDKVEKWFSRNCGDVLDRACTPAEKGDLVAWLITLK